MEYHLTTAMEELKQGEEAGLNYIYAKTYNYVYLRAKNILRRENDVQQLMKDVYLKMLESSDEIETETMYEWLGKCVYTLGCSYYRRKKAREGVILETEKSELLAKKNAELDETTYVIQKRLEELPDLYQATFYAFYYDYMPVEEIAQLMDCTPGIIINRLNYTRKYMQKALENYQEEKKIKVSYSVEAVCIALRKWSIDHCLGITTAQAVYSDICKSAKLQAAPIYLEGKEFAGVNNTVVYHKQDDFEPIQSQFELYGKKPGIDKKVVGIAAGVLIGLAAIILAIVLIAGAGGEDKNDKQDGSKVEEEQNQDADVNQSQDDDSQQDVEQSQEDDSQQDDNRDDAQGQDNDSQADDSQSQNNSSATDSSYILPESNTRLLTRDELTGLTKEQLRLARNEIFARHGMIFGVDDLDAHFGSKSWYNPTVAASEFYDKVEMSLIEEENITLIQQVESER